MRRRASYHGKERLVQRLEEVNNFEDAKKMEAIAWHSGKTINHFQSYPRTYSYLRYKKNRTNECSIRVYRNNLFIWRGKKRKFVTAYPLPQALLDEIEKEGNE